jgi:FdhD protein
MRRFGPAGPEDASRAAPEESAIAIVHDAVTYAVMMATPAHLEDLAIGLSLTEGVIASAADVREIETVSGPLGVEVRLWLTAGLSADLAERRRTMAAPTGCGLCGVESLEAAARFPSRPLLQAPALSAADILAAMADLEAAQTLGRETRAVHAAGLWRKGQGLVAVREDVGRHNALDKLAGALARDGQGADGVILLTSRLSVEMVQKAAAIGAPVIAAVSAPTSLAVRTAQDAGITLIAVVRADGFEVFTHPWRVVTGEALAQPEPARDRRSPR